MFTAANHVVRTGWEGKYLTCLGLTQSLGVSVTCVLAALRAVSLYRCSYVCKTEETRLTSYKYAQVAIEHMQGEWNVSWYAAPVDNSAVYWLKIEAYLSDTRESEKRGLAPPVETNLYLGYVWLYPSSASSNFLLILWIYFN